VDIEVILDARARASDLAALAQLAERQGIGGVWVSSLNDSRDPFTNLSIAAANTHAVRMGPIAVNPYDMHPLRIAAALLSLNEIASGRARLVLGGGGEALEALGLKPLRRVRAVRECVQILKSAARGEQIDFEGQIYTVRNCRFGWLEAPAPPIYVGAGQEQMLRMAAQVSDGIMMSDMPPGLAARTLALLDQCLAESGRTRPAFRTSAFTAWHVYADADRARREARRWLLLRGIFRPWLLEDFLDPADAALVMRSRPAFFKAFVAGSPDVEGVPEPVLDAMVDNLTICGSLDRLDQALEKLAKLRAAGLGGLALRLYADPADSIRLIGEQVLPAFART
jgi:5,10-methylenetetrahydromethanopterin reductase